MSHTAQGILDMLKNYEPPFNYANKHGPSIGLPDVNKKELCYLLNIELKPGQDLKDILNRLEGEHYEDLVDNFKLHGHSHGFKKLIYDVHIRDERNKVIFEVIETLP